MPSSASGEHAAIITGISRGLGAALARELLERRFTVLGIGRADNSALAGDRYRFVRLDLADAAGIDAALEPAFEEVEARRPASVCLLNNAATVHPRGSIAKGGWLPRKSSLRRSPTGSWSETWSTAAPTATTSSERSGERRATPPWSRRHGGG